MTDRNEIVDKESWIKKAIWIAQNLAPSMDYQKHTNNQNQAIS